MQLGLVGLGKMGFSMRERLRDGGHDVSGDALMAGGSDDDVVRAMPIFDTLRQEGERADGFIDTALAGAGHCAKMIHPS